MLQEPAQHAHRRRDIRCGHLIFGAVGEGHRKVLGLEDILEVLVGAVGVHLREHLCVGHVARGLGGGGG